MSRDEVIKLLKLIKSTVYLGNRKFLDALEFAISYLRQPEPQWIPCSERLPEDEQFILATYKTTDRIHVCQYHEDGSRNQWYSLNDMCRAYNIVVLAWMPLPEPYKEGE